MKTTARLFYAAGALSVLASCASDEPAAGGSSSITGGGEKAYLNVQLTSTGDLFRSTDFEDENYQNGTEHDVNSAKFLFFDEQGNYVLNAKLANPSFGEAPAGQDKVEWMSTQNVLVLEDLTANNYPTYMMTVINMPDFTAEATMEATARKLSVYAEEFAAGKQNFVMTTTSYSGTDANHDDFSTSGAAAYNVTKLVAENFRNTPEDALNQNPVDVYVERLAAKVQLKVSAKNTSTYTDGAGITHTIYRLEQTVAGDDNDNNGNGSTANTEIWLEVQGWGLNATAKNSYMSKVLAADWFTTAPFKGWNSAERFRSFWGESTLYGLADAAENNLTFVAPAALNGTLMNEDADYAQYCYENTNAPANIVLTNAAGQKLVYENRVTHVALKTRLCDSEGNDLAMVSFRGTLFLEDSFKAYALRTLNTTSKLNYYILVSETETEKSYRQVDASDITLSAAAGTYDKAELSTSALNGVTLYAKSIDADGKEKYTEINGGLANLNSALASVYDNSANSTSKLFWYNGGGNVYYIPVEHNALVGAEKDTEGYYGVVRNHWYQLDINSFSRVGHALNDPDNGTVVIRPDEPEDPLYYVGARINIVPWRVISQKVDL